MTAIKTNKEKVSEYVNRLDNYDAPELADYALRQHNLYEEAFLIYKKAGCHEQAIEVLLNNSSDLERAQEFAERVATPEVWSKLGEAQLRNFNVSGAIDSYIKAEDTNNYLAVIRGAEEEGCYKKLIKFLLLCRKKMLHQRDNIVDSEIIFAYAKEELLTELEDFINSSNQADIGMVGDRCYADTLYEAARILFSHINNFQKLTSCLVKLQRFSEALESARRANYALTWKEVNFACVAAREFRLAALAGVNIIIHPDHLEELIQHYEKYGYSDELISLLESGMPLERAHIGIFTELGALYAKYQTKKLMDHCRNYYGKLNILKLLRECQRYKRWKEAVFLYIKYDEFDNALNCMMEHSPSAWNHETFTQVIQKATNQDLKFRAMIFYLEEQPMMLNDLLKCISSQIDHSKAVHTMRRAGHLPLILPWLQSIQMYNTPAVNEAINEILVEMEDYEALRDSVTEFNNFDHIALAQRVEKHPLIEMRRIAAYLYRSNQRYPQSLAISKADQVYQDAMETVQKSENPDLVEEVLRYFVDIGDKEAFCSCTYICYEYLRPDVVLELAWRAGYIDFSMPFFIQYIKDISLRLYQMEKKEKAKEKKEEEEAEQQAYAPLIVDPMGGTGLPGFSNMQALPGIQPMGGMGTMGGMGMGTMQMGGMGTMSMGMDPMTMMMTQNYQNYQNYQL